MFINFSNHPSSRWSQDQLQAAEAFGEIIDMMFPEVDPHQSEEEIKETAKTVVEEIVRHDPDFVMCQGEFCLSFAVATLLKEKGIRVGGACSERLTEESVDPEGRTEKKSYFRFVRFREY